MSRRRFAQVIIGSVVAGFFVLAAMGVGAAWLMSRAEEFGGEVEHTYEVETTLSEFRALFERAEAARRGYLLSAESRARLTYEVTTPQLQPLLADIRELVSDNPTQIERLDQLQPLLDEKVDLFEQTLALRRQGDLMGAVAAFNQDREQELLDRIRALTADMARTEQSLLTERNARQTANNRLLLAVVGGAGIVLAVLAFASLWAMRAFAEGLIRSEAELRDLNLGLEAAVQERTADLTRANEEIQRFAYIVSHDLRSPLVNIMGFTSELEEASKPLKKMVEAAEAAAPGSTPPDARTAVEVDLPESIDFIRTSTRKMDRLINAILKLSREGRRSLHPEPLEMKGIMDGIASSLYVLAEQKAAEIVVEPDLPDIESDRLAIEQVFSNLIENALKYLKPGRPGLVRVRGRLEGARVVYEVEDNGRGIDPKDHERIFELFRRAGAQDTQGEGIGLAHVRALVYRLGGLIDCTSELDRGATFRLSLPRVLATAPGRPG